MALQSIIQDFEVRQGLIVLGTSTVTSSTGMTSTLQVYGGAAIDKNLIVGSTAEIWGASTLHNDATVEGATYLTGLTATDVVSLTDNTQATTLGAGALTVAGGAYLGNNLVVNSSAESTATVSSNALYVQGGAGIGGSLYVQGPAVFQDDVIFAGTTTYVYSTNTVYTDNFIDLHVPDDSSLAWAVDDGKDIGFIFNYYDGADKNGFLGLDSDTRYLEWFSDGTETDGTFTSGVYGTFKTGQAILTGAADSSSSSTGALQVAGGIGVGGAVNADKLYSRSLTQGRVAIVGADGLITDDESLLYDPATNQLTANISSSNTTTNVAGGTSGALVYQTGPGVTGFIPIGAAGLLLLSDGSKPIWATTSSVVAGAAFTSTNLFFGDQYQIPFQTAPGSTSFEAEFKYNYDTNTLITENAYINGITNATSTETGALQVVGGVGVGGNIWVGGTVDVAGDIATQQTTFNLLNTNATTVNFAGVGTAVNIGADGTGYTDVRNQLRASDTTNATDTSTGALVASGGAAVGLDLQVGGSVYVNGNETVTGDLAVNGGSLTSNQTTFNLLDSTVTTLNIARAGTAITIGSDSDGSTSIRNITNITTSSESSSAASGALVVTGGVGIGGNLYVSGSTNVTDLTTDETTFNLVNTTATTVNFAGEATAITIGAETGYTDIRNELRVTETTESSSDTTGALIVGGGAGIAGNTYIGGDVNVAGNVTTDSASIDIVNTTATTVNFAGEGTAITIGAETGYTEIRNFVHLTSSTIAVSGSTGALVVDGGVGIGSNLWVANTLRVQGASTIVNLSAQVTTVTNLTVSGNEDVAGILTVTNTQNSNATSNGAVRVSGGVGVVKDIYAGGAITVGATNAATSSTVVPALYSNNMLMSSFTKPNISGNSQVDLDVYSSLIYRSARYFVQIVDGSDIHISEISLFHDSTKAYINEYGIATNNGQLGTFDAEIVGDDVVVRFTPTSATDMTIKMARTTITL